MGFCENLTSIREKRNLTQPELARLVDVSQPAISQFERGKTNPSPDTIGKLAKALNVTTDSLILGKEEEQ